MKKSIVELSNERLITFCGLTLAGGAPEKSELVKHANRMAVNKKQFHPGLPSLKKQFLFSGGQG